LALSSIRAVRRLKYWLETPPRNQGASQATIQVSFSLNEEICPDILQWGQTKSCDAQPASQAISSRPPFATLTRIYERWRGASCRYWRSNVGRRDGADDTHTNVLSRVVKIKQGNAPEVCQTKKRWHLIGPKSHTRLLFPIRYHTDAIMQGKSVEVSRNSSFSSLLTNLANAHCLVLEHILIVCAILEPFAPFSRFRL